MEVETIVEHKTNTTVVPDHVHPVLPTLVQDPRLAMPEVTEVEVAQILPEVECREIHPAVRIIDHQGQVRHPVEVETTREVLRAIETIHQVDQTIPEADQVVHPVHRIGGITALGISQGLDQATTVVGQDLVLLVHIVLEAPGRDPGPLTPVEVEVAAAQGATPVVVEAEVLPVVRREEVEAVAVVVVAEVVYNNSKQQQS